MDIQTDSSSCEHSSPTHLLLKPVCGWRVALKGQERIAVPKPSGRHTRKVFELFIMGSNCSKVQEKKMNYVTFTLTVL